MVNCRDPKLSNTVRKILEDSTNTILVSAVSLWEIAIKHSIGKLTLENFNIQKIPDYCNELGFDLIPLDYKDVLGFENFAQKENHKDPFDRMLIYQSLLHDYNFISADEKVKQYKADGLKLSV